MLIYIFIYQVISYLWKVVADTWPCPIVAQTYQPPFPKII